MVSDRRADCLTDCFMCGRYDSLFYSFIDWNTWLTDYMIITDPSTDWPLATQWLIW